MNTRAPIEGASPTVVLSVTFNDDCSSFAVGLNTGYCVYASHNCSLQTSRDFNAGIGLVQMMGKANLIGLVGGGMLPRFAANKLVLWDDSRSRPALEISALTPVRGVQLSKERIAVVLQNSVRIYHCAKPPGLIATYETANNPRGLCCMSAKKLAFPGRSPGHVQLITLGSDAVSIIPAHSSAIRAIQLSRDGEFLATASDTGTLIRVFSTSSCAKIAEFRRGIDSASIFSLAFSPDSTMLACTSDKFTLHVFDIPEAGQQAGAAKTGGQPESEAQSKWGVLSKIPLLPRVFSDRGSFAKARFENGDETLIAGQPVSEYTTLGTTRPEKGVLGWLDDSTILVVSAGRDPRWERFVIREEQGGIRSIVRDGWKRYIGGS